jgi:transposase-like protein
MTRKKVNLQESNPEKKRARRKIDDTLKVKIVLESLKETEPLTVLASRYEVHPNQIGQWRKQFLGNAQKVFSGNIDKEQELEKLREERNEYARKVGELTMDVEFLKKNLRKLGML